MDFRDLPAVNALLNATAAILLVWGYSLIRRGKRDSHRRVMTSAFTVSALFLISYLVYHSQVGSVRFRGSGPVRVLYFSVLLAHTVCAALVPFLAVITLWRGWRGRFPAHRRIARWTLPVWLFVSVSGVAVYLMLYHLV